LLKKAPIFSLPDINGTHFNLSHCKGKIVFLDFWTKWCPSYRKTIPAIKELHKIVNSNDVVLVGINIDEKQSTIKQFIKDNDIKYNVLLGDDKVCEKYKINAFPSFFIIDTNSEIIKYYRGYYEKNIRIRRIEKEWKEVINALIKELKIKGIHFKLILYTLLYCSMSICLNLFNYL
jgi:thiol-disulfide isomerase/thioredoxin